MKKTIFSFALLFVAFAGKAQLTLDSYGFLSFNGPRYLWNYTTWHGTDHVWKAGDRTVTLVMDVGHTYFGASSPSLHFLNWDTGAYNTLWATNYYLVSDISLKTGIRPLNLNSAIKTMLALRPVTYQWKNQIENRHSPLASNPQEIGFIAQEVERVIPEIVMIDPKGNKLINYNALIPILTGAIQELNARVEALEKQLNAK